MARLFRVNEDGSMSEVDTTERLVSADDGRIVAGKSGDGTYVLDYLDGKFQQFGVADGVADPLSVENTQAGRPHVEYDAEEAHRAVTSPVSQFGAIFPADSDMGTSDDRSQNAYED